MSTGDNNKDKELVHDAWLEVNSDPEKYTLWQNDFINSLEKDFKDGIQTTLSLKQTAQVVKILTE